MNLAGAKQSDLVITRSGKEPVITVDNLELAHFTYLLLASEKIRDIVDTISTKTVLVLGRFTPERKIILDLIRHELRKLDYVPLLLDFEKPQTRDFTETISTLAHLSRFIIADLTEARSLPHELAAIVPSLPSVPVVPIVQAGYREWAMLENFSRYPWVLAVSVYDNSIDLSNRLTSHILSGAEAFLRKTAELKLA